MNAFSSNSRADARFLFVFFVFWTASLVSAQSDCYWPGGAKTATKDNFTACAGGTSQCCRKGNACLSNGLCFNPDNGKVYRGGCTDSKWTTSSCPQYCNSNFANSAVSLMPCPPSAPGVWQWWCGNDYQNVCGKPNDKTTIFDYPENGFISAIAGNETIEAVASPPSSTAGVGSVSTGTSISTPLTDSCTSAEPNVQGSKKPGVSTSVPIAIGVAIGVPLALLSLTFGILYQRERKRRVLAEQLGFAGQGYTGQKAFHVESKPVYELGSDPPQLDGSPISK